MGSSRDFGEEPEIRRNPRRRSPSRVGFGPFVFDESAGSLLRGGEAIPLAPKPYGVLQCLLDAPGELVTKEDLLDAVWPGTAVTDQSVVEAVRLLRLALGDDPQDPAYIQTVHRRGYRFIAPVETSATRADEDELRLAIMSFTDLSRNHDQEYFCQGIVEELFATLSGLSGVQLRWPASVFAGAGDATPLEVADRLGADVVLEGALRKSGSMLSISVRLTSVEDGVVLSAFKCDGPVDQALAIQEDLSGRVVRALNLSDQHPGDLIRPHSTDLTAYDLYLMSRHYLNIRTIASLRRSMALGEQAVERDPGYGLAYSTVALGNVVLASHSAEAPRPLADRARYAADRALEIDESLAEAHTALGLVRLGFDWDWDGAEVSFMRALELAPRDPTVHCWFAFWHLAMGDGDKALALARRAEQLETTSLIYHSQVAWVLYYLRRSEEALDQLSVTLSRDRRFWRAYVNAGWCYMHLQEYTEAIAALETAVALNDYSLLRALLARAYAHAGRRAQARAYLESLQATGVYVSPYFTSHVHLALGDPTTALEWLERSLEDHEWFFIFAHHDPALDPLRDEPAFRRIMKRVGLRSASAGVS